MARWQLVDGVKKLAKQFKNELAKGNTFGDNCRGRGRGLVFVASRLNQRTRAHATTHVVDIKILRAARRDLEIEKANYCLKVKSLPAKTDADLAALGSALGSRSPHTTTVDLTSPIWRKVTESGLVKLLEAAPQLLPQDVRTNVVKGDAFLAFVAARNPNMVGIQLCTGWDNVTATGLVQLLHSCPKLDVKNLRSTSVPTCVAEAISSFNAKRISRDRNTIFLLGCVSSEKSDP